MHTRAGPVCWDRYPEWVVIGVLALVLGLGALAFNGAAARRFMREAEVFRRLRWPLWGLGPTRFMLGFLGVLLVVMGAAVLGSCGAA